MWSKKRVLRKDKKQLTKKRILFISLLSGLFGVSLIVVGVIILYYEPVFVSPLPFLTFRSQTSDEQSKNITKILQREGIQAKEVRPSGGSVYQITLSDGATVYINAEKNLSEQLSSLQRIASRLTMEGKKFVRLDLRYAKPVIVLR